MHKSLLYAAYGWLTLSGILHFSIDVMSQYLRGKRAPGPEATLYYGLNTAYALGQLLFGVMALLLVQKAPDLLDQWPFMLLTFVAASAWLALGFVFIEYREPKIILGIFVVLAVAAAATR